MAETIRYARIGKEDVNFGTGTFEVRLADGRVVVLTQVDIGAILSDADLSSRDVTLDSLTVTTLTATTVTPPTTLRIPEKADPASPLSGEVWINSAGTIIEYADDATTPAQHALVGDDTTQTLTNKTLTAPAISAPVLSGTATGTYVLAGTPSLGSPLDVSDEDLTSIDEAHFSDAAANPTATGRLRRSGNELLWRQSLATVRLVYVDAGTIMLFQQTAAPTGWTKLTTQNDKVLRVVSGAASTGGATAFSTIFNSGTSFVTNSHTLTTPEIPSHTHLAGETLIVASGVGNNVRTIATTGNATSATGGDGGHTHTLTMDLAFVDLILASKD